MHGKISTYLNAKTLDTLEHIMDSSRHYMHLNQYIEYKK